jgi:hypothetical protein
MNAFILVISMDVLVLEDEVTSARKISRTTGKMNIPMRHRTKHPNENCLFNARSLVAIPSWTKAPFTGTMGKFIINANLVHILVNS